MCQMMYPRPLHRSRHSIPLDSSPMGRSPSSDITLLSDLLDHMRGCCCCCHQNNHLTAGALALAGLPWPTERQLATVGTCRSYSGRAGAIDSERLTSWACCCYTMVTQLNALEDKQLLYPAKFENRWV